MAPFEARPAALLYATVRSACACAATSALTMTPGGPTVPGGNPVIELPGLTPRFPGMVVVPSRTLVTDCPPSTEKLPAVPRPTAGVAALAPEVTGTTASNDSVAAAATTAKREVQSLRIDPVPLLDIRRASLPRGMRGHRGPEQLRSGVASASLRQQFYGTPMIKGRCRRRGSPVRGSRSRRLSQ